MSEQTATGYLLPGRDTRMHETPLSLVVPCEPCCGFHWHGAGTVEQPTERAGTVAERISHCPRGNEYERIRIAAEPFRREWMTTGYRWSAAYRRHRDEVA
ncbi:hypothetical protein ACFWDK_05055 [Micromonospora chalcea]